MHKDLTFVGQSFRTLDGSYPDVMTSIASPYQPRASLSAIHRGVTQLVHDARSLSGVHYGVIDWSGRLLVKGVLTSALDPLGGGVATALIGRHSHADSRTGDDSLGLRHAFLVHRVSQPETALLFDLASAAGTFTLAEQPIASAIVDLPAVVRVGSHLLVMLSSEHASLGIDGLVELASVALLRENPASPKSPRFIFTLDDFSGTPLAGDPEQSPALAFTPMSSGNERREETRPLALVPARHESLRQTTFRPTGEALARGFMIGRYERCSVPGTIAWDDMLSRVHALLFAMGDHVYLADLSSTNGTTHETLGTLRLKHLADGDTFWLGRSRLQVEAGL